MSLFHLNARRGEARRGEAAKNEAKTKVVVNINHLHGSAECLFFSIGSNGDIMDRSHSDHSR